MDPNANLEEQLCLSAKLQSIDDAADEMGNLTADQEMEVIGLARRLAELVMALNYWLLIGGCKPESWAR